MREEKWVEVAGDAEVEESGAVKADMEEEEVLLTRVKGRIRAFGSKCTHHGGPLEQGLVVGSTVKGLNRGQEIVCPWHHARFDLLTGRAVGAPAVDDLPRYPVKVSDGRIHLDPAVEPSGTKTGILGDQTFAVVGAGAAGSAAAETLRREGFAGRIALISAEESRPYDRTHLSKKFLSGEMPPDRVFLREPGYYESLEIELMLGRRVAALDPGGRFLTFEDGDVLNFDQALIATGGVPRRLKIPGDDLEGCFYLRSLEDARAISASAEKASRAVMIGAGFIGLEAAAALRERGLEVRVVAPEPAPMIGIFGERVGQWLRALHEENGVVFHLGETPAEIAGDRRVREVRLSGGERLEAGLVLIGAGIVPVVDFLEGSGLVENGSVPVNRRLQTRADFVFAAGDMASVPDLHGGERRRVEHWVEAQRQGQEAARSMLGVQSPFEEIPFFWTRQHGVTLQYIGHAPGADRLAYRGRVEDGDFLVGYYQDGELRAVAGVPRAHELIALEQRMRAGLTPTFEEFGDPGSDLTESVEAD